MTIPDTCINHSPVCYAIKLGGRVQGVGFRPFVYRLATAHQLVGEVSNVGGEVHIIAQGDKRAIVKFQQELIEEAPQIAQPTLVSSEPIALCESERFAITASRAAEGEHIHVPPDYFTCEDCLHELADPADRRYAYPFINCTQCGPRYTLIQQLPYDRARTSMQAFALCPACEQEYHDPASRRYHAEPLACPDCGPVLTFQTDQGKVTNNQQAMDDCLAAIRKGALVAIKGIGGFHLCCAATNPDAIARLRERKARPDKPLAVMFPETGDDGLATVREYVQLDDAQALFLKSPIRPVVLLTKQVAFTLPDSIAPGLDQVGVMLPYSPLHHLLLNQLQQPVIATSANLSGEPVLTDNHEVQARLQSITRNMLYHNRDIVRPADDSVFQFIAHKARPVRIGRGYAPLELALPFTLEKPVLACGGHMKNTVALAFANRVVISPHIGDMGSVRAQRVFENTIADLQSLYQVSAQTLVCDAHPHYSSSRWARDQDKPVVEVLHHHAHAACLAGEFPEVENWLVFAWDGVGYGGDGTLWGGETFYGQAGQWQRVASMRPFYLPGGDKAAREPWRAACAIDWEINASPSKLDAERELLFNAWQKRVNSPQSTAVGRLFDAAAAMLNLCSLASHEGQAPMALEAMASRGNASALPLSLYEDNDGVLRMDWEPLFKALNNRDLSVEQAAYQFHASLAEALRAQAHYFRERRGVFAVGLSGGVFQNKLLCHLVIDALQQDGFEVYLPGAVPVNDGGLCYGQVVEAAVVLGGKHD